VRSGTASSSLACSRFSQFPSRVPFWLMLGMSVRLAASSDPIMLLRLASPTSFRTAESRTFIVEGESHSMPARHSINKTGREAG